MADAGASGSKRVIQHRFGVGTEEEARAQLQSRLNTYCKAMFWSFVTLLVFLQLAYTFVLEDRKPVYSPYVFGGSAVMLAVMAILWRVVLPRASITVEGLYRLDLMFAGAIGSTFGASAALQHDLQAASYTSLIFGAFNVFTRALLVPSSARRTAATSVVTFVPILASGVYLGFWHGDQHELPRSMLIGGGATFAAIAIAIATNGSGIIYGLRRQVSEAMQLGVYKLDRRIGSGGMGEVYRAHHAVLRRPTAVKLLLPDRVGAENLDRFEREVQHMSKLTHPNTVAVFDYGRSAEGILYYAMEYLDGIDLEQLVRRFRPQPAGRVVHILAQVCGALQEAHDAGLTHRDIKPANIILCRRGGMPDVAKVVDFGLVTDVTDEHAASQSIMGTPAYMAPEAVTGGHIGPAADLYALGAVGYFLLTGQRLFDARTLAELVVQHATATPRAPSAIATSPIPRELEAILMRCLEKAPSARFASARALAEALATVPVRDWSSDDAERWWRDFEALAHAPDPADVATLTIDLGHRQA